MIQNLFHRDVHLVPVRSQEMSRRSFGGDGEGGGRHGSVQKKKTPYWRNRTLLWSLQVDLQVD